MKKRMLLAAGAVLVAASVSAFVYVKNESSSMDGLFNANVEALADSESGGKYCFSELIADSADQVVYCGTCDYAPGRGSIRSACYK